MSELIPWLELAIKITMIIMAGIYFIFSNTIMAALKTWTVAQ